MARVAILLHPARPQAGALAAEAVPWLESRGHSVRLLRLAEPDGVAEDGRTGPLARVRLDGVDLAVSLGGDGTFLRLVPFAHAADVPVLGVNFGRLGYLLEVEPETFLDALEGTLAGRTTIEERCAIEVSSSSGFEPVPGEPGGPGEANSYVALNEMVIEKTVPGHMVHLSTAIDGEPAFTYKADGVLVATPTGSTAYNLSAGGPVVAPALRAMILTPVAPHLSMDRSIVLLPEQTITVTVLGQRPAGLVLDGRHVGRLAPGAEVACRLAATPVRIVSLGDRGFARLLRTTLSPARNY